jgi:4-hydroxythreonine-4-phosphate dehydrogenase
MTGQLPTIAVTSGDPGGIGPEITAHLFSHFAPTSSRAIIIGSPDVFDPWRSRFGFDAPVVKSVDDLAGQTQNSPVVILDTGVRDPWAAGVENAGAGTHAGRAIEVACELAENLSVQGIVTAPISKKSLNLANFDYPGHTEMLARYLMSPRCQMMMVYQSLRVVPMTRHLPLRDVADHIDAELIETCVRETVVGLRGTFGIEKPRVACAALNPHGGDGGVIGSEEIDVIAPALEKLKNEGIDVSGPFPADALFQSASEDLQGDGARYDAYISMYHDQGLVPFKMLAQRRGVNVTIGLPVIRTSVDHGAAFDIAGKGIAETDSLFEAYQLAEQFSMIAKT